ncbi:MAG TPA: response regulator transcription factor [Anaerolineae bacterium]
MLTDADTLRVLIIADDPLARAGLATLLGDQPACTIVGQVPTDFDIAAELDVYQPDVAVWDLGWDPASTLDRLSDLAETGLPLIALLPDETHTVETWSAGARGLLPRDVRAERLAAAVPAVAQGFAVLEPELMTTLAPDRPLEPAPPAEALTPRELEVLQLVAEGLSNKAIGRRLEISEHTVKFHINAIMSKLGAQSRTEAVVQATRLGLILL